MNVGATYYLFKEGIEPKWEDPKNLKGGSWTAPVPNKGDSKKTLDAWWLNTVRPGHLRNIYAPLDASTKQIAGLHGSNR